MKPSAWWIVIFFGVHLLNNVVYVWFASSLNARVQRQFNRLSAVGFGVVAVGVAVYVFGTHADNAAVWIWMIPVVALVGLNVVHQLCYLRFCDHSGETTQNSLWQPNFDIPKSCSNCGKEF
jgi:hypothetical protein